MKTPSKSILFNIGRQADATGRADRKDTILPAFLQVFNEHCGYCEQNPAVAQFERELDEEEGLNKVTNILLKIFASHEEWEKYWREKMDLNQKVLLNFNLEKHLCG